MDSFDKVGRGYTEIFRQHIGLENQFCSLNHAIKNPNAEIIERNTKGNLFDDIWFRNFEKIQFQPEIQIFKETNLFLTLSTFLHFFKKETKIIFLSRDIRGVISSFKKGGLFYNWDYSKRYSELKKTILNNIDYKELYFLFNDINENNPMDVLICLYFINSIEIWRLIFQNKEYTNILNLKYESLVENQNDEISKINSFLNVNLRINDEINSKQESDFNINKYKENAQDWLDILSEEEIKYIYKKVLSIRSEIENCEIKEFNNYLNEFGLDLINFPVPNVKVNPAIRPEFVHPGFYDKYSSKEELLNSIDFIEIQGGKFTYGNSKDKRCCITGSVELPKFKFATKYITNGQFAYFLNWLKENGVDNEIKGLYLFYNTNMPASRGGRIFLTTDGYRPLNGFEDHPVNWVTWIGAAAFAKWVGCRLPLEIEWEYVASLSGETKEGNNNYLLGDTSTVGYFPPDNSGVFDMFGNVKTWCQDWYFKGYSNSGLDFKVFKNVRGGAWNSYIPLSWERNYKPFLLSARSIGIRLVKDQGLVSTLNPDDLIKYKLFINDNSKINQNLSSLNSTLTEFFV